LLYEFSEHQYQSNFVFKRRLRQYWSVLSYLPVVVVVAIIIVHCKVTVTCYLLLPFNAPKKGFLFIWRENQRPSL